MTETPPKKQSSFLPLMLVFAMLIAMSDEGIRTMIGNVTGFVLDPVIGFGGHYPVLTIMLGGSILVAGTTLIRHFATDWIETARIQAYQRHFQREMMKARKENNTFRLKQLNEYQPKMMEMARKTQSASLRMMPWSMAVALPLFSWMSTWLGELDYVFFAAPWNPSVTLFGTNGIIPWFGHQTSVLPHWILLYGALSIPLGSLLSKGLKYMSWRERWEKRHPGVHE